MVITSDSHLDHGLSAAHIAWILKTWGHVQEFKLETVDLPEDLASLECGLYGPTMGDEPIDNESVTYVVRGDRKGVSRMIARPKRPTRKITVIMGLEKGQVILYTAFGGPITPREPFDPDITTPEALAESQAYWAQHALAL